MHAGVGSARSLTAALLYIALSGLTLIHLAVPSTFVPIVLNCRSTSRVDATHFIERAGSGENEQIPTMLRSSTTRPPQAQLGQQASVIRSTDQELSDIS